MTLSHLCASCGKDLSRIAAPPDPHYGLAVVVCPHCRAACVRSRGEWVIWVRHLLRLDAWLTALALQISLLFTCVAISAMATSLALTELHDLHHLALRANEPVAAGEQLLRAIISPLVPTSIISGIWISLTLSHWRRGTAILAWVAVLFVLTLQSVMMSHLNDDGDSWSAAVRLFIEPVRLEHTGIVFLAASLWVLPGLLVGSIMRRGSAPLRRVRFAWRRRRARRHRRGR